MRRRNVIAGLVTATVSTRARFVQQALTPVMVPHRRSPSSSQYLVAAFPTGLAETGFIEGHNVAIEYRCANDQYNRLPVWRPTLCAVRLACADEVID
jgi:putative tryptophan/tyrosine transport system substrate-binding protein